MREEGRVVTRREDFKAIDRMADRAWLHWNSTVRWPSTAFGPRHMCSDWHDFIAWLELNWGITDEAYSPSIPIWEIVDPKKYAMFLLKWS